MKPWLARAVVSTAMRSEEPRTRFARWTARWFAGTPTVPESRFQHADEPFPHHWRSLPDPWPTVDHAAADVRDTLAAALAELPATWREVVIDRDVHFRNPAEITERMGLTPRQQRTILNRARARLRERLAQSLVLKDER